MKAWGFDGSMLFWHFNFCKDTAFFTAIKASFALFVFIFPFSSDKMFKGIVCNLKR